MKVYTKTGDKGTTSLVGGKRVSKAHPRVDAYGTVDELISYIGVIRSYDVDPHYKDVLYKIQDRLMVCAALLASDGESTKTLPHISAEDITLLENEIDMMDSVLPPLNHFVLPGGCLPNAFCNVARSVCRRAERGVIGLTDEFDIDENIPQYLNRLSDYLFVLSRKLAKDFNADEVYWIPEK